MHIQVKNLSKSFGRNEVVRNISFEIEQGKLVGLLGPSGGGKTTILRMLAGLEQPNAGEIYFHERFVNSLTPQERGIGFVFQNYALFKHMNVYENIAFGLKIQKRSKKEIANRVEELLELTSLTGLEKRLPHQLSGGQRQRVAFARALAPEPQMLFLDEPFSAIDVKVRKELRRWLKQMIDKVKITTIFVTHDQEEAIEIADEIVIINQGVIEQMGTPWKIYTQPKTSFVGSFIGESTILESFAIFNGFESNIRRLVNSEFAGDFGKGKIMIRPENVEVGKEFEFPKLPSAMKGTVKQLRFRGTYWEIEVKVGTHLILAHHPIDKESLTQGDEVYVVIHRLYVFDQEQSWMFENESQFEQIQIVV